MAIRHLADGQDFGPEHFSKDFGFKGSAEGGTGPKTASPPYAQDVPTRGPKHVPEPLEAGEGPPHDYAHGGHAHMAHGGEHHPHGHCPRGEPMPHAGGGHIVHHEHGGHTIHHPDGHVTHHHHDGSPVQHEAHGGAMHHLHPHGHHVVRVEHHADGRVLHHHAHGGHTVHHPDGHISHHHADGTPAHMAAGGGMGHGDGTYVNDGAAEHHRRHGMVADTDGDGMAMGGRTRLPRSMIPPAERRRSPIETPPRNPMHTTSPRNSMPGGQMGYGVEPSAEPDMAGSDQGIPQMKRGGRHRAHHEA
jgi:hypothetical protein